MLSIVVPTLNEAENIKALIPQLKKALKKRPYEIVLVDDNSQDGTPEIINDLIKKKHPIKFVVRKTERGLATAVIEGFRQAKGDFIAVMDADLSHPPEVIPKLYDYGLKGVDVVVASRYIKGGGVEQWPFIRRLTSKTATQFARILTRVRDPMSGCFMFRKSILKIDDLRPIGYKILLEILVKCPYHSFVEIPYIFRNRFVGKSKLGSKVISQYLRHLLRLYTYKIVRRLEGRRREI